MKKYINKRFVRPEVGATKKATEKVHYAKCTKKYTKIFNALDDQQILYLAYKLCHINMTKRLKRLPFLNVKTRKRNAIILQ